MNERRISHFIYPDAPRGTESGVCALCGFEGDGQYCRDDVLDITTSNVTAIFELRYDHICAPCYGIWSKPKHWHRGILATPGRVVFPVISVESVTPERPTWGQALRELPIDEPRAVVLTTDPKKRVWPFARVSQGAQCWLYLHDPSRGISGNQSVHLPRLLKAITAIEGALAAGFTKTATSTNILTNWPIVQRIGIQAAQQMEASLAALRKTTEFTTALIVAQKGIPE